MNTESTHLFAWFLRPFKNTPKTYYALFDNKTILRSELRSQRSPEKQFISSHTTTSTINYDSLQLSQNH